MEVEGIEAGTGATAGALMGRTASGPTGTVTTVAGRARLASDVRTGAGAEEGIEEGAEEAEEEGTRVGASAAATVLGAVAGAGAGAVAGAGAGAITATAGAGTGVTARAGALIAPQFTTARLLTCETFNVLFVCTTGADTGVALGAGGATGAVTGD